MHDVVIKRDGEDFLRRRHPWVFSGAIARASSEPATGETVRVVTAGGEVLGLGAWSPQSQIRVRMWTFGDGEAVDEAFFSRQIAKAIARRGPLADLATAACRLVNAESDGLPGLIVDRYAGTLVCQFLSAGSEFWRTPLVEALRQQTGAVSVYERSDSPVREKEGLPPRSGLLEGAEPPERIAFEEHGCRFECSVRGGHKTGFYLDQRDNRRLLMDYAAGREILNAFSYTGAFGVAALKAGAARVTNLDSSADALAAAVEHTRLNGLDATKVENVDGDAFAVLRTFRDSRRSFDAIVLDPPKFIHNRAQLQTAARAYKDINLLAFKLLRPGGLLFTFSCSEPMDAALFQKIVADAALDAKRDAVVLHWLSQSADHPVALNFPEGRYLKGLVCQVVAFPLHPSRESPTVCPARAHGKGA